VRDDPTAEELARRLEVADTKAQAASVAARTEADRAAIAREELAALRGDLEAAQRMTAHALHELEICRRGMKRLEDECSAEPPATASNGSGRRGSVRAVLGRVRRGFGRSEREG
jgi:hypothetical protein